MIGLLPKRPSGTNAEARFHQWVWDSLRELRQQETQGQIVNRTTRGTQIITPRGSGGIGMESAFFAFRQNYGDYISGVLVSNVGTESEAESSETIYIAKPPEMRETGSETIGGVTYTYTTPYDYSDQSRAATDGTTSYDQYIVPRYILDETETPTKTRLVFAVRAGRTGVFVSGVECVWQEVSNRAWAREYTPPS